MQLRWISTGLLALALIGASNAAEQERQAEKAIEKAETLEQKAVEDGSPPKASRSEVITKSEVQAVDPAGEAPLDDAITCLARSIYWEAKGQKVEEMEAVASVVMNRLQTDEFPRSVCEVVKQGSEAGNCQFSWWCDGRPDSVQEEASYTQAKEVARRALNGQLKDRTKGALFFHDRSVSPSWAATFKRTHAAGDFFFYRPRD
ncbi:cell wall hydrolase [Halopseudomonas nanhaiensis]|uniref:cell wall hydrolase n=1 Tax=Halopseudomonas nanhaiensis TaxID=2830842 RepID=UPI001CBC8F62|nr:cell wall hydrolase [Halopseudomonas nanhaiensis]UAW97265.1 cell wall hydrolase [Halopseudomonas nanhaiensis]